MKKTLIKSYLIAVALLAMPIFVFAESATISWNANNDDDLAGYRIYYGTTKGGPYGSSTALIPKTQASYIISDLSYGTYYFVVVALDTSDNESVYSSEVSKTIASTTASTTTSKTTTSASTSTTSTTTTASTSSSDTTSSASTGSVSSPIPLPSAGIYGQVSGNASQLRKVDFSFSGRKSERKVYYRCYDVDSSSEVSILINGTFAGYAKRAKNNRWSKTRVITLKANYMNESSANILTFQSNSGSPNTNPWGVQIIRIK